MATDPSSLAGLYTVQRRFLGGFVSHRQQDSALPSRSAGRGHSEWARRALRGAKNQTQVGCVQGKCKAHCPVPLALCFYAVLSEGVSTE